MLKKLLKYEIRWTCSTHLPIIAAIVLATILIALTSLFIQFTPSDGFSLVTDLPFEISPIFADVLSGVAIVIAITYLIVIIGSYVASAILANFRFYTSLFTSRGYLSFTLPATPTQLYLSKMIPAILSMTAVLALIFFSMDIIIYLMSGGRMELISFYATLSDSLSWIVILGFIVNGIVGIVYQITWFYFCLCVGQTQKNKVIVSILTYFISYTVTQAIVLIFILITLFAAVLFSDGGAYIENLEQHMLDTWLVFFVWGANFLFSGIIAVFFCTGKKIMTKHINLE